MSTVIQIEEIEEVEKVEDVQEPTALEGLVSELLYRAQKANDDGATLRAVIEIFENLNSGDDFERAAKVNAFRLIFACNFGRILSCWK